MRPILVPLALALLAAPAAAQEASDPAIEAVIRDQLADFTARDVPGAWEHASPMIQGMFGTPENFGAMVERGYPMVWDNADARFLDLAPDGDALNQTVRIRDAAGAGWLLLYRMVEVDGRWRIDGVQVAPAPELSA